MWQMAAGMIGASVIGPLVSTWVAQWQMKQAQKNQQTLFANNAELQKLSSDFEALNKKALAEFERTGKFADAAIPPPTLIKNSGSLAVPELEAKSEEQIKEFMKSVSSRTNVNLDDIMSDFKAIADGNALDNEGKSTLKLTAEQFRQVGAELQEKLKGLSGGDAATISAAIGTMFNNNGDLNLSSIQGDDAKAVEARKAVYQFGHSLSKVFEGGALLQEFGAKNEELKQKITAAGGTPGSPGAIANTFPAMAGAAGALAMGMPAMTMGAMPGGMLPFGGSGFDPAATMLQTAPLMNAQEMAMCAQLPADQQALFLQQKILARQQQMMMYISNKARMEADTAKSIIQNIR